MLLIEALLFVLNIVLQGKILKFNMLVLKYVL